MKNKTILLTGDKGFIGSYLSKRLRSEGYRVLGFDKKNGEWQNILISDSKYFKWLAKQEIDLIIHLAAIARVRDSVENPDLAMENVNMIYNMVEFARKNKIKKFIFSSSRETYGNIQIPKYTEEKAVHYNTASPYAMSKLCGESILHYYNRCYGGKTIVLRFSNVFGNGDPNDRFVPRILKQLPKNETVEVYGGDKVLDFTYMDDVIDGILIAIKNYNKLSKERLNTFNVAYGKGVRLVDVAQYMKKKLGSKSKIKIKKNHVGEVVYYKADINKFTKLTGWKPKINVYKGIDLMLDNIPFT